ncbi:hypothetical protein ANCDUO_11203 [Ancylostoma duodenale]|uniref:Phlebovirus glycoprotein G2 fusion domain-containing protein n=1 Tax=Ancylostoma duodenale TaxID=51022 RepID=A0A0C2CPB8_9BILA|nr:hypothetical protein ANCDUO_11203 [Ancylostoma duodenale]
MLKMIVVCHLIALIFTTGLLVHCPQRSFVGINTEYNDLTIHTNTDIDVKAKCNQGCYCKIMLRVVPFDQRTLALGINWTFLRLLGKRLTYEMHTLRERCMVYYSNVALGETIDTCTATESKHSFRAA